MRKSINRSAGRLINELSRAAHIYFQSEFKKYSIGHAQIITLLFIARNEGIQKVVWSGLIRREKEDSSESSTKMEVGSCG